MSKQAAVIAAAGFEAWKVQKGKLDSYIANGVIGAKMTDRAWKVQALNDVTRLQLECRRSEKDYVVRHDPKYAKRCISKLDELVTLASTVKDLHTKADDRERIDAILNAAEQYRQSFLAYKSAYESGVSDAETMVKESHKALEDIAALHEKIETERQDVQAGTMWIAVVLVSLGIALTIIIAIAVTRAVTKPINRAIDSLSAGSDQVSSAAEQLSSSSQQLSQGASEQASSLEEISSSLEEMASMTKQNADNTKQVDSLMREAGELVGLGKNSMSSLSTAMNEIKESSDSTAKIIKTIDEIAMQTNLLALNAAVEAARAGEAGRGFAVVAEEVRNLAQRSAEAAKDTAQLIEGSQRSSENGVQLVDSSAKSIDAMAESAGKVASLLSEIAAASDEQSKGIDQINSSVALMDRTTQGNAANAEESASASEELSGQAQNLNGIVSELATLVGGNGTANGTASTPGYAGTFRQETSSRNTGNRLVERRAVKVLPALAPATKIREKEVRPEDVIPLEDDTALESF